MADNNVDDDVKTLHSMGYAQELARTMGQFSNFAISFSIICILSGGINSLGQGVAGAGGASLTIGWIVGGLCALLVTFGMAQIASAFPTAGGLYHWSSILGGRFWGWLTAWFNLFGLITVLAAINVGTFNFFLGSFGSAFGITAEHQLVFVALMTASHALINHIGIKATTKLTDFSGYLILFGAVLLAGSLFYFAGNDPGETRDFGRLFKFENFTGDASGGVWPTRFENIWMVFAVGLLLPIYTLTGYDASAHTSEETVQAAKNVPKGIINSVLYASIFALLFSVGFVLAIPNMADAAKAGWGVFFYVMDAQIPATLRYLIYGIVFVAQYICGLATVTSVSRMIFAFSRDKGLPLSAVWAKVSPKWRTPVAAIWVGSALAVAFTAYAKLYGLIAVSCVIALYFSYVMPTIAGFFAYGKSWTKMGPWNIGGLYKLVAILVTILVAIIIYIGVQPPNDAAITVFKWFIGTTALVWVLIEWVLPALGFKSVKFQGPPTGASIDARAKAIEEAEKAINKALG